MSESAKCALVTGALAGIGEATVRRLRELGWDVVAVACREERLAAPAVETGCEYVVTDLSDETAVDALAARVLEGGPVDVLVNNVGGALRVDTIAHADPDRWIVMYYRNIMTALCTTRAFLSGMRERGGDFVFFTSTTAHGTYPGGGGYVAAKYVERIIVNTLRQELVGEPVRIVEIAPGMVKTSEFLLNHLGSGEATVKVYEDVTEPLLADGVADAIRWALIHLAHVNTDSMILQPVAQAMSTLLARQG